MVCRGISGTMKSRLTDWCWSMMILPMDSLWEQPQSFREILLHLNGRMRFGRQRLLEIEWSPSRTGLINPVAVFEPVELEGTTVSRASVHNISIMEELELGVGDTIQVYKANMIIPQIAENLTRSGVKDIPDSLSGLWWCDKDFHGK